ncbi:hypothetical protein BMJ32_15720 [Sinorhizobium medicae]|nr:hypothetical protein BMJ32_15720 [Sinorhizobium medicae]PLU47241.1 hypothetical protein BMJ23_32220 [Sinorhizobium medicae]PLU73084.1 hypothetical protein BMJ21_07125 [Sinorhizobium medicae]RVH89485.1 hypothetical protein CN201_19050 [Sinorhizobium medicae]RVI50934.1 hypothetical protein CN192_23695 [Sinorhizobium medicae]
MSAWDRSRRRIEDQFSFSLILGRGKRVPGIQQRHVGGAKESFQATDAAWLDSCDEHRNDGEEISRGHG